ncbi:MAG: hypothetical protein WC510_03900, partial [Candidatus Omnitrophota bacterium]
MSNWREQIWLKITALTIAGVFAFSEVTWAAKADMSIFLPVAQQAAQAGQIPFNPVNPFLKIIQGINNFILPSATAAETPYYDPNENRYIPILNPAWLAPSITVQLGIGNNDTVDTVGDDNPQPLAGTGAPLAQPAQPLPQSTPVNNPGNNPNHGQALASNQDSWKAPDLNSNNRGAVTPDNTRLLSATDDGLGNDNVDLTTFSGRGPPAMPFNCAVHALASLLNISFDDAASLLAPYSRYNSVTGQWETSMYGLQQITGLYGRDLTVSELQNLTQNAIIYVTINGQGHYVTYNAEKGTIMDNGEELSLAEFQARYGLNDNDTVRGLLGEGDKNTGSAVSVEQLKETFGSISDSALEHQEKVESQGGGGGGGGGGGDGGDGGSPAPPTPTSSNGWGCPWDGAGWNGSPYGGGSGGSPTPSSGSDGGNPAPTPTPTSCGGGSPISTPTSVTGSNGAGPSESGWTAPGGAAPVSAPQAGSQVQVGNDTYQWAYTDKGLQLCMTDANGQVHTDHTFNLGIRDSEGIVHSTDGNDVKYAWYTNTWTGASYWVQMDSSNNYNNSSNGAGFPGYYGSNRGNSYTATPFFSIASFAGAFTTAGYNINPNSIGIIGSASANNQAGASNIFVYAASADNSQAYIMTYDTNTGAATGITVITPEGNGVTSVKAYDMKGNELSSSEAKVTVEEAEAGRYTVSVNMGGDEFALNFSVNNIGLEAGDRGFFGENDIKLIAPVIAAVLSRSNTTQAQDSLFCFIPESPTGAQGQAGGYFIFIMPTGKEGADDPKNYNYEVFVASSMRSSAANKQGVRIDNTLANASWKDGLEFLQGLHSKFGFNHNISITGASEQDIAFINCALDILKVVSPSHYEVVVKNIKINLVDSGTTQVDPNTGEVTLSRDYLKSHSAAWIAGMLAHEADHCVYAKEGGKPGLEAELRANNIMLEVMVFAGASIADIIIVKVSTNLTDRNGKHYWEAGFEGFSANPAQFVGEFAKTGMGILAFNGNSLVVAPSLLLSSIPVSQLSDDAINQMLADAKAFFLSGYGIDLSQFKAWVEQYKLENSGKIPTLNEWYQHVAAVRAGYRSYEEVQLDKALAFSGNISTQLQNYYIYFSQLNCCMDIENFMSAWKMDMANSHPEIASIINLAVTDPIAFINACLARGISINELLPNLSGVENTGSLVSEHPDIFSYLCLLDRDMGTINSIIGADKAKYDFFSEMFNAKGNSLFSDFTFFSDYEAAKRDISAFHSTYFDKDGNFLCGSLSGINWDRLMNDINTTKGYKEALMDFWKKESNVSKAFGYFNQAGGESSPLTDLPVFDFSLGAEAVMARINEFNAKYDTWVNSTGVEFDDNGYFKGFRNPEAASLKQATEDIYKQAMGIEKGLTGIYGENYMNAVSFYSDLISAEQRAERITAAINILHLNLVRPGTYQPGTPLRITADIWLYNAKEVITLEAGVTKLPSGTQILTALNPLLKAPLGVPVEPITLSNGKTFWAVDLADATLDLSMGVARLNGTLKSGVFSYEVGVGNGRGPPQDAPKAKFSPTADIIASNESGTSLLFYINPSKNQQIEIIDSQFNVFVVGAKYNVAAGVKVSLDGNKLFTAGENAQLYIQETGISGVNATLGQKDFVLLEGVQSSIRTLITTWDAQGKPTYTIDREFIYDFAGEYKSPLVPGGVVIIEVGGSFYVDISLQYIGVIHAPNPLVSQITPESRLQELMAILPKISGGAIGPNEILNSYEDSLVVTDGDAQKALERVIGLVVPQKTGDALVDLALANYNSINPAIFDALNETPIVIVDSQEIQAYFDASNNRITFTTAYIQNSSVNWLTSVIAHEYEHAELFKQKGTVEGTEVAALEYQLSCLQSLGGVETEVNYLKATIEQEKTLGIQAPAVPAGEEVAPIVPEEQKLNEAIVMGDSLVNKVNEDVALKLDVLAKSGKIPQWIAEYYRASLKNGDAKYEGIDGFKPGDFTPEYVKSFAAGFGLIWDGGKWTPADISASLGKYDDFISLKATNLVYEILAAVINKGLSATGNDPRIYGVYAYLASPDNAALKDFAGQYYLRNIDIVDPVTGRMLADSIASLEGYGKDSNLQRAVNFLNGQIQIGTENYAEVLSALLYSVNKWNTHVMGDNGLGSGKVFSLYGKLSQNPEDMGAFGGQAIDGLAIFGYEKKGAEYTVIFSTEDRRLFDYTTNIIAANTQIVRFSAVTNVLPEDIKTTLGIPLAGTGSTPLSLALDPNDVMKPTADALAKYGIDASKITASDLPGYTSELKEQNDLLINALGAKFDATTGTATLDPTRVDQFRAVLSANKEIVRFSAVTNVLPEDIKTTLGIPLAGTGSTPLSLALDPNDVM